MKILGLAFTVTVLAGLAGAAPLCTSGSLAVYTAPGFECDLGGATWSGFTFGVSGFASSPVLDASDISVTPITTLPSFFGFLFNGQFVASAGDSGAYAISYEGTSGTSLFADATLLLGGVTVGPGGAGDDPLASAVKVVRESPGGAFLTVAPLTVAFTSGTGLVGTTQAPFIFPSSTISVEDTLTLSGPASASQLANKFLLTDVPEPASFFLFGSGLLGLTFFLRRRNRSIL